MVCGVRMLADYNFCFELCLKGSAQMASAIELVRRCPEVRFVLDHIGKPMIAQGELEPWQSQLRQLAALENVCCKLSGLIVEADSPALDGRRAAALPGSRRRLLWFRAADVGRRLAGGALGPRR